MPELPEVETVRRGLLDKVLNRVIKGIRVNYPKIIEQFSEIPSYFSELNASVPTSIFTLLFAYDCISDH